MTAATAPTTYAVGIIRVSSSRNREETLASPDDQRQRYLAECERQGFQPSNIYEEIDVSGGKPLAKRDGLRSAVEDIEAGRASVLIAPYFDRLCRSLRVQDEVVSRVEAAGGKVLALDFGQVTNGTASQWLSGTILGAMNEYYKRSVAERVAGAHARAVEQGIPPWAERPLGYIMENGKPLVPDPIEAPIVAEAFALRANGASINRVWRFLDQQGIKRGRTPVANMLCNRLYLGELRFGKLVNLKAHEPIVNERTWRRAQRAKAPRGRLPKSEFLLARTQVLRCGSCGSTLGPITQHTKTGTTRHYKCTKSANPDCPRQVAILADMVEARVIEDVKQKVGEIEASAGIERDIRQAEADRDSAQQMLDAVVEMLDGFEDIQSARQRLSELRAARDQADDRVAQLAGTSSLLTISAGRDWDSLTLDARRALIKRVVARVEVRSGRGPDRISVYLLAE